MKFLNEQVLGFANKLSIYYLVIIFLITLLLLGILSFGITAILAQGLPAVLATVVTDSLLKYFKLKTLKFSLSALITGLIIGLTAQFGVSPWILALIGVLAILIKVFIKLDGRHIFNPAASGLLIGMLALNSYPSWWAGGNYPWIFLIWIPIMLYKMKRWAPMIGFLVPVIVFSGTSILTSVSLLFFLSVMLIEPKTSPYEVKNGLIYGIIVGVVYILLSQTNLDPLITSLLVGNLGARLLKKVIV